MKGKFCFRAGLCIITFIIFILAIGLSSAASLAASGDVVWSRTYADSGTYEWTSIARGVDGGYILAGCAAERYDSTEVFPCAVKVDDNGAFQWSERRAYGNKGYFREVIPTLDGGYLLAGSYTVSDNPWLPSGYAVKTDSKGQVIFQKAFGGEASHSYRFTDVLQSADGGYVLVGADSPYDGRNLLDSKVFVVKTDADGNPVWSRTYGHDHCFANSVAPAPDGGYVIACLLRYNNADRGYLIKIDDRGDMLWDKEYARVHAESICPAGDGGYVFTGGTSWLPTGGVSVVKVGPDGAALWNLTTGVGMSADAVVPATGGGYVAAGIGQHGNGYAIKVSEAGRIEWERITGSVFDRFRDVIEAADGSYIFAGIAALPEDHYTHRFWLVDIEGERAAAGSQSSPSSPCLSGLVLPVAALSIVAISRRRLR